MCCNVQHLVTPSFKNRLGNIPCSWKNFSWEQFLLRVMVPGATFFQTHWMHLAAQSHGVPLKNSRLEEFGNKFDMRPAASDTNALMFFAAIEFTTARMSNHPNYTVVAWFMSWVATKQDHKNAGMQSFLDWDKAAMQDPEFREVTTEYHKAGTGGVWDVSKVFTMSEIHHALVLASNTINHSEVGLVGGDIPWFAACSSSAGSDMQRTWPRQRPRTGQHLLWCLPPTMTQNSSGRKSLVPWLQLSRNRSRNLRPNAPLLHSGQLRRRKQLSGRRRWDISA